MLIKIVLLGVALMLSSVGAKEVNPDDQVRVRTELSSPVMLEKTQDKNYLKVSLTGFSLESAERNPINLALVIDRSTSMSGDRIEKAREAAILAINLLSQQDTLSVVAYDNGVEVVIPSTKVKDKKALIAQIKKHISPRGMTALFAGVSKGIAQVEQEQKLGLKAIDRIILLSDGQANIGPTSNKELSELAKLAAKKGIAITTIGLGENYNEDLMVAIAGYSDGNHTFVASSSDLETAFAKELNNIMSVIAQDVIVTITLSDGVKPIRLLGREGDISGKTVTIKLNQLYSEQEKYVLLEVVPNSGKVGETKSLAKVDVTYANLKTKENDRKTIEDIYVSYTKSIEEVNKAIIEDVVVESEIQITALENEKAIELLDKGKREEAQLILQANATRLSSLTFSDDVAEAKAKNAAEDNMKLLESSQSKSDGYLRKAIKENDYNIKIQKKK